MLIFAFFNLVFNSLRLLLSNFSFANPTPSGKISDVSSFLTALKKYASFLLVLLSQTPNENVSRIRLHKRKIDQVRSFPKLKAKASERRIIPAR
ncbi:MAG: hypothetical protein MZV63_66790 [Marinilabiliales bacterium]|nr:hypothetical protein [Marinilabiliales bacterium]